MTDSFVTQCPHCQTSFRVNHAQLSVARGVVRCGSCLQVFNAAKQLLEQAGKEPVAPVVPAIVEAPPPAEPRAISQKQWTAAELDLDSLDLDGGAGQVSAVQEIMERHGFFNQKLFYRMFKERYHCTPRQARRMAENNPYVEAK